MKSQTVSGQTPARVKGSAADSADHIKMSDFTYQGLAGVCSCTCILMYVCVFCSRGAMSHT